MEVSKKVGVPSLYKASIILSVGTSLDVKRRKNETRLTIVG